MSKKQSQDGSFYQQIVLPVDDFQVAPWSPGDVETGDPDEMVKARFVCDWSNDPVLIDKFLDIIA